MLTLTRSFGVAKPLQPNIHTFAHDGISGVVGARRRFTSGAGRLVRRTLSTVPVVTRCIIQQLLLLFHSE